MANLKSGDACPKCREGEVYRVRRRDWMRWLPSSKYYKCDDCGGRFLTTRGWTLRLPKRKTRRLDED